MVVSQVVAQRERLKGDLARDNKARAKKIITDWAHNLRSGGSSLCLALVMSTPGPLFVNQTAAQFQSKGGGAFVTVKFYRIL